MNIPAIDYKKHPAYQYAPTLKDRYTALRLFMPWFFRGLWKRIRITPGVCTDGCELGRKGAVMYRLSPEVIAKVRAHAQPYVDAITENKKKKAATLFKETVLQVPKEKSPEFHETIGGILRDLNIIPLAEHYRGYPLHLTNLAVQVRDPEDGDWREHFKDAGIKDPPTSYFHIDGSIGHMKALMYLTDVAAENGPFGYIFGSNKVLGIFENAVRWGNDKPRLDTCDPVHRRLFAALPAILQKKSEFGNDMMVGCDDLIKNEYHFLSARDGNFFLFDNTGIHRGGLLTKGRRIVVQMNFRPPTEV